MHLADNSVIYIYSIGVGSVVFEPTVYGKQVRAVEFSNISYIPDLTSNHFSCLSLTSEYLYNE